jgi:hypothetical protein
MNKKLPGQQTERMDVSEVRQNAGFYLKKREIKPQPYFGHNTNFKGMQTGIPTYNRQILPLITHHQTLFRRNTCFLTPSSTDLPEKLTGPQVVRKFPAFYGTRRFITAFTTARHLSLS